MTEQENRQLRLEIDHIFESGANEMRIFEMVRNFIDGRRVNSDEYRIGYDDGWRDCYLTNVNHWHDE